LSGLMIKNRRGSGSHIKMAKCDICRKKVEEHFLKKVFGTYIKDAKGKRKLVCSECQRRLGSKVKEELK